MRIVIFILGVLATVIIPNLSKFVGSGTVGAANGELATIKTAVSAYAADYNGADPTLQAQVTDGAHNTLQAGSKAFIQLTLLALSQAQLIQVVPGIQPILKWAK